MASPRTDAYLATFRAVARKYPHKAPGEVLADLVRTTPGEEGKWFAAAKEAGLYDEALALARQTPCDPRTLARAARDLVETQPAFALEAGMLALHWLVQGYGYEITGADVWAAYDSTAKAAEKNRSVPETKARITRLVAVLVVSRASLRACLLEDGFGKHHMHSLITVDELGDVDVSRDAGQHIGVIAAEMLFIDQEFNHLADRHFGSFIEVLVKAHADVVARRFCTWVLQFDVFSNNEFQLSNQRCFQSGNVDLSIPLSGMTVSDEEERTACMNR
jgi:hypothetical protein